MGSIERKKIKIKCFCLFLSFAHNLSELSLIPIWTWELKFITMKKEKPLSQSTCVEQELEPLVKQSYTTYNSFSIFLE